MKQSKIFLFGKEKKKFTIISDLINFFCSITVPKMFKGSA